MKHWQTIHDRLKRWFYCNFECPCKLAFVNCMRGGDMGMFNVSIWQEWRPTWICITHANAEPIPELEKTYVFDVVICSCCEQYCRRQAAANVSVYTQLVLCVSADRHLLIARNIIARRLLIPFVGGNRVIDSKLSALAQYLIILIYLVAIALKCNYAVSVHIFQFFTPNFRIA